ncbi:hypothetical protein F751_6408 [Auxenochlorella protothecoides]|uniref:Uncharacterized protein n=1 Tax=Auxenochlorella protothecoides TaxID=3075 RepID=A0A087SAZ5_AUXPR|nr:hypothetical protein F751_6408 [Auxenochlorella protothecoides]KFM22899.1 hypothetical protein F751_6408 [Auxenochlorella protothecoides]RMZ52477.1 hypothetical protein APUTEX25_003620 [Auxenochlorella protothecoides]|eukprot:RMZ52477.1 hypothetical protein APUTEX25_003620 [Auxenochlorella protothecoides]
MLLRLAPGIECFLQDCVRQGIASDDLAKEVSRAGAVPWDQLKRLHCQLKAARPDTPNLYKGLARRREQAAYDAMVHDVLAVERAAAAAAHGFGSYRQQVSLGLHVVVTMAAFYAFGLVAGRATLPPGWQPHVAGLGLATLALLVESLLFVIRSSAPATAQREAAARALRERLEAQARAQRAAAQRDGEAGGRAQGGEGAGAAPAQDEGKAESTPARAGVAEEAGVEPDGGPDKGPEPATLRLRAGRAA